MDKVSKITFTDRDDLIKKIVLKKADIPNAEKSLEALTKSLLRYKRGDKKAMQEVIRIRKKMLHANAEAFIELEEDNMYNAVVAEINILDIIDESV